MSWSKVGYTEFLHNLKHTKHKNPLQNLHNAQKTTTGTVGQTSDPIVNIHIILVPAKVPLT